MSTERLGDFLARGRAAQRAVDALMIAGGETAPEHIRNAQQLVRTALELWKAGEYDAAAIVETLCDVDRRLTKALARLERGA